MSGFPGKVWMRTEMAESGKWLWVSREVTAEDRQRRELLLAELEELSEDRQKVLARQAESLEARGLRRQG